MSRANTGLQTAADEIEDSYLNIPMKISDAASQLRRRIGKNDSPYVVEVTRGNNAIVDRWYEGVLRHIAGPNMTIPAPRAHGCFMTFYEGLEITKYQEYKSQLMTYPEEKVKFWVNFLLTKSVKELHEAGIGIVSAAWSIITNAIRYYFADLKWTEIYSKSTVPLEWDKLANDMPSLMNRRALPFGLNRDRMQEMEEKVRCVTSCVIEPHVNSS